MKTIYFVRHGETDGNVGLHRQTPDTPLNEKGRSQAAFVAKRCAKLPIDMVVSSTMLRTRQTADYILGESPKPIEYSDLFIERLRPSQTWGKLHGDPKCMEIDKIIHDNFETPGFRHSDEETFDDIKNRALSALKFLAERPEQNILVVTHGFFMRIIMAVVIHGKSLTAKECSRFIRTFHMENTGLSILGYDESKENPWWLWVWNDHAHLG